jgi:hypothetical protein
MPFVGDGDLFITLDEVSLVEGFRVGGSIEGDLMSEPDEAMLNLLLFILNAALLRTELWRDGEVGWMSSGGGLLDMPSKPRWPETNSSTAGSSP